MKKSRIFFALVVTAVFLILQPGCADNPAPTRTLKTATSVLNGRCPEMVDQETRIDSIVLTTEGQLEYYYTLLFREKRGMNTAALTGFLIPGITKNVHDNAGLRMHRDSSVSMDFIYRDRYGEFIMKISLGPEDYR